MRHLKSGRKLSRRKDHRTAMLANLAASIIQHERVHTTDAKAKEVRPFIEKMVTFARRGDIHARRIVLARLKGNQSAVKKLFDEIGPRYTARPGGYTRIIKLGFRQGDNSAMSLIEFVGGEIEKKTTKKGKRQKAEGKKEVQSTKLEVRSDEPAEPVLENNAEETAAPASTEVRSTKLEVRSDEENSAEAAAEKETEIQENETESAPETKKEPSETALEKKEAGKDDSAEDQSEKEK